jgi:hypothetical protein
MTSASHRLPTLLVAVLTTVAAALAVLPAAHAQEAFTVSIRPEVAQDEAVRGASFVRVSGTAPTATGRIAAARFVGLDGGAEVSEQVFGAGIRNAPATNEVYIRNDNGTLSGRLKLDPCIFPQPRNNATGCTGAPTPVTDVLLELTIEGLTERSDALRVDAAASVIRRFELLSPTRIRVVFSEPVRSPNPDGTDSALDWQVTEPSRQVVGVRGATENDCVYEPGDDARGGPTGCTRTLELASGEEDDRPTVRYDPARGRNPYVDGASNAVLRSDAAGGADEVVVDRVRPAVPSIDAIDGRAPDGDARVASNEPAPTLVVGNMTKGHALVVTASGPGEPISRQFNDLEVRDDRTATVQLPTLPADGEYVIEAVAVDANGNRSDDTTQGAPRDDGTPNPAFYAVDRVAPQVLSARRVDADTVEVAFSEPLSPAGNAGQWTLNGETVTASGEGQTRTLAASTDLPEESTVAWQPSSGVTPVDARAYRDAGGNELGAVSGVRVVPLPALGALTVTAPAAETYTREDAVTVAGTVAAPREHLVVDLFDSGATSPRATADVRGGAWSFTVTRPLDGRASYEVQLRDAETGARGPRVRVPDVVRDTDAPEVAVTQPSRDASSVLNGDLQGRRVVAVGEALSVEWTASDIAVGDDVNRDHGRSADVDVVFPSGRSRRVGGDLPFATRQFSYTITDADLAAAGPQHEARFGVAVTDLAGNTAADQSATVVIDPAVIGYAAAFVKAGATDAVVEVRFPQALVGDTAATDWRIDDLVARSATKREVGGRTVVTLVAAQPLLDPNATPRVRFVGSRDDAGRLRADDQREVTDHIVVAADRVAPALTLDAPGNRTVNARSFQVTGRTDVSSQPTTVRAFRANADGSRAGGAVASTSDTGTGRYTLTVPLNPNALNRFVVEAVDQGGNVSAAPAPTFAVVEDSTVPVVTIAQPEANQPINDQVAIRWTTRDANARTVTLQYRVNNGELRDIASGEPDDGAYDWSVPTTVNEHDVVEIVIIAVDAASNRGSRVQAGLRVDRTAPQLTGAKTTGARSIDVFFSEGVVAGGGASGFSVPNGPRVTAVEASGTQATLRLAGDLATATPDVAYDGQGVRDRAGNTAPAAQVTATAGFTPGTDSNPSTGGDSGGGDSGGGDSGGGDSGGGNSGGGDSGGGDSGGGSSGGGSSGGGGFGGGGSSGGSGGGAQGAPEGNDESEPTTGSEPAPATGADDDESPTGATVGADGGTVVSDDGQLVLTVPPRALDEAHDARLRTTTATSPGYRPISAAYELVLTAVDDGAPLTAFARYACLSFRPDGGIDAQPARGAVLRPTAEGVDELSTRVDGGAADACLLTPGTFVLGEAERMTVRVKGPDPALDKNRFATAAGLSQLTFATADTAVLARADDYPDALAAAALASAVEGPVLLAQPDAIPLATQLELDRLGVRRVILVGGQAALSEQVADAARGLGFEVERIAGPTRYHTAAAIAERLPVTRDRAYLATGKGFADALSASAGSAFLDRPIFLTEPDGLPEVTLDGLRAAGITGVDLLGGPAAVNADVEAQLRAEGFEVRRIAGPTRYHTAVELARVLVREGMTVDRLIAASGVGDGKSSPDALAAGPVAARFASPLLLVPQEALHPVVAEYLQEADGIRGVVVAGGPAALSEATRADLDAAAS